MNEPLSPETIKALGDQIMRFGYWGVGLIGWWIFWRYNPWRKKGD